MGACTELFVDITKDGGTGSSECDETEQTPDFGGGYDDGISDPLDNYTSRILARNGGYGFRPGGYE